MARRRDGRVREGRKLRLCFRTVCGRAPVECEVTKKQAKPGVCSGATPSQSNNSARGAGRKSAESGRKSVGKRPETAGERLQMGLRSGPARFCEASLRVVPKRRHF